MSVVAVPRFNGGVAQETYPAFQNEHSLESAGEASPYSGIWPDRIRAIWARCGTATLELARTVRRARAELKRGEWCGLWASCEMPFSRRKAQMLLVIAGGLDWANVNTCAHLPQGWRILYCLARLKREYLEHLIAEGVVHSRLKLAEVKKLIVHLDRQPGESPDSRPKVLDRLTRLSQFVATTLKDWSPEQCAVAKQKLLEIAAAIEAAPLSSTRVNSEKS